MTIVVGDYTHDNEYPYLELHDITKEIVKSYDFGAGMITLLGVVELKPRIDGLQIHDTIR